MEEEEKFYIVVNTIEEKKATYLLKLQKILKEK